MVVCGHRSSSLIWVFVNFNKRSFTYLKIQKIKKLLKIASWWAIMFIKVDLLIDLVIYPIFWIIGCAVFEVGHEDNGKYLIIKFCPFFLSLPGLNTLRSLLAAFLYISAAVHRLFCSIFFASNNNFMMFDKMIQSPPKINISSVAAHQVPRHERPKKAISLLSLYLIFGKCTFFTWRFFHLCCWMENRGTRWCGIGET